MYTTSENCAIGKKTSQMLHIMRCNLYGCLLGNHILQTWITTAALRRAYLCQIIDALFSIDSARRTQAKSCDLLVLLFLFSTSSPRRTQAKSCYLVVPPAVAVVLH